MMLCHHSKNLTHCSIWMNGDRIVDHSVLGSLHTTHLVHLLLDGHVLVDDTDTAGTSHRDRELSFSHSVHCSRNDRSLESDISGELARHIYSSRKNLRMCRNQQYVVEGKSFNNRRVCKCLHLYEDNIVIAL